MGYAYTGNAHLATLTYPDSLSVSYAPNALGQPSQAGTYATNVTYHPNGAIAGFTYGNGIVHTMTQNLRGLPDRSRDLNGSTSVHDDSYDYDQNGNVLAISDAVTGFRGDRDMVYDDLNRLTQAISPMFGTASYAYDAIDNLTHVQVTGGGQPRNHDYCYDEYNRLTNVMTGGCSGGSSVIGLGYDVQGNLANKSGVTYGFDYGNRLRSGGPETYRYDAHGRRVRSSSSAGLAYSFYSQSGQILFQRDERSSKRRQYIYLGGSLVAEHSRPLSSSTATITYQHTDALGSPVATTNSAKTVLQRSEYEPYGYLLNRPMQDGPGYTGHVTDAATGLVYMQARYYDPLIGDRFLSVDPVTPYSPGGGFNRYWYANNNPYRFTDPDGRQTYDPYLLSGGKWNSKENGQSVENQPPAEQATTSNASLPSLPSSGTYDSETGATTGWAWQIVVKPTGEYEVQWRPLTAQNSHELPLGDILVFSGGGGLARIATREAIKNLLPTILFGKQTGTQQTQWQIGYQQIRYEDPGRGGEVIKTVISPYDVHWTNQTYWKPVGELTRFRVRICYQCD